MAHYVIVGGGRVGTRLAAALDAAGHGVALVDRDPRTVEGLAPGFSGELVAGVGFDRSALLAAGRPAVRGQSRRWERGWLESDDQGFHLWRKTGNRLVGAERSWAPS